MIQHPLFSPFVRHSVNRQEIIEITKIYYDEIHL